MNKQEILERARGQLAEDLCCAPEVFLRAENVVVPAGVRPGRRRFQMQPYFFQMATFGQGAVISAAEEILPWAEGFFADKEGSRCFFYSVLRKIDSVLWGYGKEMAGILEYYLPLPEREIVDCGCELRWYERDAIPELYGDRRWENALVYDVMAMRPDMLAVAAFLDGKMVGIAGASADSVDFWQIGIDVLGEYRNRHIGVELVGVLTNEVLRRGMTPYYGTWTGNMGSRNVAMRCGYFPAWVECIARNRIHTTAKREVRWASVTPYT